MAKQFRLFRVSLASDTQNTVDRIDFNDPTSPDLKDTKKENAYLLSCERVSGQSIGDDQPAEDDLGSIDVVGASEDVYILEGIISNTRGSLGNGQNQYLILLDLWDAEAKKTGDVEWTEGRFGIVDDNDHTNDLIPVRTGSAQIGLIWESYRKKSDYSKNQTKITIRLRISKGDGT